MNIDSAQFLWLGHHRPSIPWHMGRHAHDVHELILILRGSQETHVRNVRVAANEGDILLYRAGVPHAEWATHSLESYFISFQWKDCPADLPIKMHDTLGRVRVLLEWIHEETSSSNQLAQSSTRALFHSMLAQVLRLTTRTDTGLVETIRQYAHEFIAQPLTLDDLAQRVGMSKFHFVRKYTALSGRTPMKDIRILRIERAREMILTTSLPLKEIAAKAGIPDIYQFSKLFTRHLGVTPGSLRRTVRS